MASRSVKQQRTTLMGTSAPKPSLTGSIRSAVASRKPQATTGVARAVANAAMGTDRNGNRVGPRPTVGEADPETRRAALRKALQPGPPVKSAPKPAPAPLDGQGGPGNQRRRRVIDETVDRMSR